MQIIEPPASSFGRSSANRTFCKLSNLQPARLEEAQLIERFANHRTSVQRSNHLLELRHDGIKLSLSQKRSTSFSWIEPARRSTGRNNPDTQHRKCSVSSTSFSTCTCSLHPGRSAKNYETLHGLIPLGKSSGKATRRQAEGMISRPLLQEVIYGMLPLLPTMQEPFRYCRRHWVKPHPICRLFSSWADQFPLAPAQTSGSGRTLTLDWFQGFSLKESRWLPSFCRHDLEQSQTWLSISARRGAGLGLSPWTPSIHSPRIRWGGSSGRIQPYSVLPQKSQTVDKSPDGTAGARTR